MKKNILSGCVALFFSLPFYAQVGINTKNPAATLHIEPSSSASPTGKDGIIVPKVQNLPSVNPSRLGQFIFLENNATLADGFYYWDGSSWVSFPESIDRNTDNTIYSFDGQGYTGTALSRNINFSRYIKASTDGFTLNNNTITVGKGGLYLISFTGNSKKPSGAEEHANFTFSVLVNGVQASSVQTSMAAESTASVSTAFSFLRRLNVGDNLTATVTKSNEGPNNYQAFGINNLTLFFIQN